MKTRVFLLMSVLACSVASYAQSSSYEAIKKDCFSQAIPQDLENAARELTCVQFHPATDEALRSLEKKFDTVRGEKRAWSAASASKTAAVMKARFLRYVVAGEL